MKNDLRERIESKKLELKALELQLELERLELERAKLPSKFNGLTAEEWIRLARTGGGCLWSLPIIGLIITIIIEPQRVESYDQFIVSFGAAAFAFYVTRK